MRRLYLPGADLGGGVYVSHSDGQVWLGYQPGERLVGIDPLAMENLMDWWRRHAPDVVRNENGDHDY